MKKNYVGAYAYSFLKCAYNTKKYEYTPNMIFSKTCFLFKSLIAPLGKFSQKEKKVNTPCYHRYG